MTLERFRQLCLKHPGATEQIQWGADLVFKVGGKMFAVACTDPAYPNAKACSFKSDGEDFAELCEREGVGPAPYLARAKWVALDTWSALPDREIGALVGKSYTLVRAGLTKKAQAALGATPIAVARPRPTRAARR
jgi:predicted DNA-binding protein (MmcQ/YjbR family)